MPSYMAPLLGMHERCTYLVPQLRECARLRPLNLQKNAFLSCFGSVPVKNSLKKYFTLGRKLKALLFFFSSPVLSFSEGVMGLKNRMQLRRPTILH